MLSLLFVVSSHVQRDANEDRSVNEEQLRGQVNELLSAHKRGCLSPGMLPMAPNRDIVKSELVPPQIKHGLIETQDSFLSDTSRRRSKLYQAAVDQQSLSFLDTSQQMPQRECVAFAGLAEHDRQIVGALPWCIVLEIKPCHRRAQLQ